jgi:hypothetical protein
MIDIRIALGAVALFAGAYLGVSLLPKSGLVSRAGKPAPSVAATLQPKAIAQPPEPALPGATEATPPAPATAADDVAAAPRSKLPDLPEHELVSGRDRIRVSALQAATAYALAPCDGTNKAAFVVAVSTYLRTLGARESDIPADDRLQQALLAAFKAGGVAEQDFPADAWPLPADLTRAGGNRPAPCNAARRAERRSR